MERHNPAINRLALIPALVILRHDTWPDLNFQPNSQNTLEDGTTSDTSLELVNLGSGLVDIEGTDDDEAGVGGEVAHGDRDVFDDVFIDGVDVVLQLGRDGDDGGVFGDGTCVLDINSILDETM
jgi:hypothetical protein